MGFLIEGRYKEYHEYQLHLFIVNKKKKKKKKRYISKILRFQQTDRAFPPSPFVQVYPLLHCVCGLSAGLYTSHFLRCWCPKA